MHERLYSIGNPPRMSEYHKDCLANGLRVITVEMPHLHSAELIFFVAVGSRCEEPGLAGLTHFLEHMVFRGTAEYPDSVALERAFEAIGGAVNASTDVETTCFHSRIHPDHLREGAALFASLLQRPRLQELETERRIILEEALEDFNEKGEQINPDNISADLLWPEHPLGRTTIGTRSSIARTSLEDLQRHHQRYFVPANTVAVAAGRVSRAAAIAAIEEHFGTWDGVMPAPVQPFIAEDAPQQAQTCWVRDSGSQVNVQLTFRTPGRDAEEDAVALRVLRRVLSGGTAARLMLRLREELGLTYAVEAGLAQVKETGAFSVDLSLAPDNLEQAISELLQIFTELCDAQVGAEELAAVVRTYLFDLDFSRDGTEELASRYGWGELVGNVRTLAADRADISAISARRLQEVAARIFIPEALCLVVVGPWSASARRRVEALVGGYRR